MARSSEQDRKLIDRIRGGDSDAWNELIACYEGRLTAFVKSRLSNHSAVEDIVQETFIGFLNSLANFDDQRVLETYLFTICSYKLTDHLRREGRRPSIPMVSSTDSDEEWQPKGRERQASSIVRSVERKRLEESAIAQALVEQVEKWRKNGDWTKLKCIELLIVEGLSNKQVSQILEISEQQVANFKFDFLTRLRTMIKRQGLSQEVFPELYQE